MISKHLTLCRLDMERSVNWRRFKVKLGCNQELTCVAPDHIRSIKLFLPLQLLHDLL